MALMKSAQGIGHELHTRHTMVQQQPAARSFAPRSVVAPIQRLHVPHAAAHALTSSSEPTTSSTSGGGAALAIYSWPTLKPARQQVPFSRSPTKLWSTQMWFEAMVQTVVKQLDGGAFLLRVGVNPVLSLQLIRLDAADIAAGWEHIQQRHLASALRQDEAVILVHPVATVEQPCVVRQTAGSPCPGCPHTPSSAAAPGGAAFSAAAATTEMLHGKFGDCCSDEEDDHHHHQHHHHHAQHEQQQQPTADTLTAFYGLVVQTRDAADPLQGCYLLKTVKQSSSSSSSCNCTHYSLNQVCKGPSLQQQYQASWLV